MRGKAIDYPIKVLNLWTNSLLHDPSVIGLSGEVVQSTTHDIRAWARSRSCTRQSTLNRHCINLDEVAKLCRQALSQSCNCGKDGSPSSVCLHQQWMCSSFPNDAKSECRKLCCPWWFIVMGYVCSMSKCKLSVFFRSLFPDLHEFQAWWVKRVKKQPTPSLCPKSLLRFMFSVSFFPHCMINFKVQWSAILPLLNLSTYKEEKSSSYLHISGYNKDASEKIQKEVNSRIAVRKVIESFENNILIEKDPRLVITLDERLAGEFNVLSGLVSRAQERLCTYVIFDPQCASQSLGIEKGTLEDIKKKVVVLNKWLANAMECVLGDLKFTDRDTPQLFASSNVFCLRTVSDDFGPFVLQLNVTAQKELRVAEWMDNHVHKYKDLTPSLCKLCETGVSLGFETGTSHLIHKERVCFVTGRAGTGKTTMIKQIIQEHVKCKLAFEPRAFQVLVLCQFNKPLANLKHFVSTLNTGSTKENKDGLQPVVIKSITSFLHVKNLKSIRENMIPHCGMIIVEEASVLGLDSLVALLQKIDMIWGPLCTTIRFVFCGDHFQLLPVNDNEVFSSLLHRYHPNVVQLHRVHRQSGGFESSGLRKLLALLVQYGTTLWHQHCKNENIKFSILSGKTASTEPTTGLIRFPPEPLLNLEKLKRAGPGLTVFSRCMLLGDNNKNQMRRKRKAGDSSERMSCCLSQKEIHSCIEEECYLKKMWKPFQDGQDDIISSSWNMVITYTNQAARKINSSLVKIWKDEAKTRVICKCNIRMLDPATQKTKLCVANGQLGLCETQHLKRWKLDAKVSDYSDTTDEEDERQEESVPDSIEFLALVDMKGQDPEVSLVPVSKLENAHCITNHASQGSGFVHTCVCPDVAFGDIGMDARWLYVAASRTIKTMDYFVDADTHSSMISRGFSWYSTTISCPSPLKTIVP